MDSRAAPAQAPRWCRPGHVQRWSASLNSLIASASSSGPPPGSNRIPSSSTRSSAATLSMRIAAPSRDISTSPEVIPDCSRSDFGITKRPALSMVVRIPLGYHRSGTGIVSLQRLLAHRWVQPDSYQRVVPAGTITVVGGLLPTQDHSPTRVRYEADDRRSIGHRCRSRGIFEFRGGSRHTFGQKLCGLGDGRWPRGPAVMRSRP